MARYRFIGETPVLLADLHADLEPGQEFEAPDDWRPEPYPHPLFEHLGAPVPDEANFKEQES